MRPTSPSARRLAAGTFALLAIGAISVVVAGALNPAGAASDSPETPTTVATASAAVTAPVAVVPTTSAPAPTTTTPVVVAAPQFATGNADLDALLPTLPSVLFSGGAQVHFGYNPVDCCHAGGYNEEPNEVWVSERALKTAAKLTYVTVHELAHSVHLHSGREAALTAAVAGAPSVRAGSPWDDSEKVADCVSWVLFPAETAASGLTYWNCPEPYRTQVQSALV